MDTEYLSWSKLVKLAMDKEYKLKQIGKTSYGYKYKLKQIRKTSYGHIVQVEAN